MKVPSTPKPSPARKRTLKAASAFGLDADAPRRAHQRRAARLGPVAEAALSAVAGGGVVLITGPSGAGRSTAINVLEDLGFEAIDNLPLSLIPRLLDGPARPQPLAGGQCGGLQHPAQAILDGVVGQWQCAFATTALGAEALRAQAAARVEPAARPPDGQLTIGRAA